MTRQGRAGSSEASSPVGVSRDHCFEADGPRAIALNARMAQSLCESLDAIRIAATDIPSCRVAEELAQAKNLVRIGRPIRPVVWAVYAELCSAIALNDIAAANATAAILAQALDAARAPYVSNLDDGDLGSGFSARYANALNDDRALPRDLVAIDGMEVERAQRLIDEARELIGDACPDLLFEIDTLVREIVLAKGRPGGNAFAGAATLFLWGAILINPTAIPDRLAMAEALTHEAGHALLTGLTGGLDVTVNNGSERYPSPLRDDARPMEGVAHAAFVLARMTMMLDGLALSRHLDDEERPRLAAMTAENASLFDAAMLTLKAHARFTTDGAAVFHSCELFMRNRQCSRPSPERLP